MTLTSAGNVGIGVEVPAKPLHVVGSALVKAGAIFTLTGDINPGNSTTTVPGTSTIFLSEVSIGDTITLGAETRTVTAIASNTSLTVDATFSTDLATDTTPQCTPAAFTVLNSGGTANLFKLDANSRISLSNNDGNTSNTVFGQSAFEPTSEGDVGADFNVAVGELAMGTGNLAAAIHNTAIGYKSLEDITAGEYNTSIGSNSMANCTNGHRNTANGYNALFTNVSGDYNTAVGMASLYLNSTDNNTAIGYASGESTTGADNTYLGFQAGKGAAGAEANNVGVGSNALLAVTTGSSNVAIGKDSAKVLTTGGSNVIIGVAAGDATVDSSNHVLIGAGAGGNGDIANDGQTAVGYLSLHALTSGTRNTALGAASGFSLTSGERNVAIGSDALYYGSTETDDNVAIGDNAMAGNFSTAAVNDCVAIGSSSLTGVLTATASGSVAIGKSALTALTSGADCLAIGYNALAANTTGNDNFALGRNALNDLNHTNSIRNMGIGGYAGQDMGTADGNIDNIFIGYAAGSGDWHASNVSTNNVGVGNRVMDAVMDGASNNTAVGHLAMTALTSPSECFAWLWSSSRRCYGITSNSIRL